MIHNAHDQMILDSESIQLVIHGLPTANGSSVAEAQQPEAREDTYIKLFFPVDNLGLTRQRLARGGEAATSEKEWEARGFRACDGVGAEGNVVHFREVAT